MLTWIGSGYRPGEGDNFTSRDHPGRGENTPARISTLNKRQTMLKIRLFKTPPLILMKSNVLVHNREDHI
jgi:hypothetical protein